MPPEVLANPIQHDIGKRGEEVTWSQSMLTVIVLIQNDLQMNWSHTRW